MLPGAPTPPRPTPPAPAPSSNLDALLAPVDSKADAPVLPDVGSGRERQGSGPLATQPGAGQSAAVAPGAAKKAAKVIQKTKPSRRLQPGDLVCGECGEGNPPPRKFCSRCGSPLESAAAVKAKWWRRLVPKRRVKTLEAGQRPGQAGVKAKRKPGLGRLLPKIRKIGGTVAILTTLAFTFVAPFRDWSYRTVITPVKDRWRDLTTQEFVAVRPVSFTSTVETPENPVGAVFDLATNTFMVGPADRGEIVITATFASPVNVDRAIVRNGSSSLFTDYSRAHALHLVFDTGKTSDLELKDQPDPQKVTVKNAANVSRIEIHVTSKYAAVSNAAVALSEIEFFTEK